MAKDYGQMKLKLCRHRMFYFTLYFDYQVCTFFSASSISNIEHFKVEHEWRISRSHYSATVSLSPVHHPLRGLEGSLTLLSSSFFPRHAITPHSGRTVVLFSVCSYCLWQQGLLPRCRVLVTLAAVPLALCTLAGERGNLPGTRVCLIQHHPFRGKWFYWDTGKAVWETIAIFGPRYLALSASCKR